MGLRVEKVQELLLRKEEVDLEKFSIAQGHKDSLAFLECHMPELKIRYEENRLSCVLHLGSGEDGKMKSGFLGSISLFFPPPGGQASKLVNTNCQDCTLNSQVLSLQFDCTFASLDFFCVAVIPHYSYDFSDLPDSCIPDSIQVSAPLSLDSEESSIKSELSTQRKAEKKPGKITNLNVVWLLYGVVWLSTGEESTDLEPMESGKEDW